MADAIALIVVGTGETTEQEVFDLLEDAYPADDFEEVGLVIPVDKDLFSNTVKNAVAWYGDDENVFTYQTEGASMTRAAASIGQGTQKVSKFTDMLTPDEFKDWDEVHVLIAMPDDPEDPAYDFYAEVVEIALEAGFKVKDLAGGLDDVQIADDEEPAPEPEPEPVKEEKPARRSRRKPKASEEAQEEAAHEEDSAGEGTPDEEPEAEAPASVTATDGGLEDRVRGLELQVEGLSEVLAGIADALVTLGDRLAEARAAAAAEVLNEAVADGTEPKTAKDEGAPKRGRGRPRTQFEVKQVWDEDEEEWVARPAGRLRKGTKWRSIHSETNEVLDEGTA